MSVRTNRCYASLELMLVARCLMIAIAVAVAVPLPTAAQESDRPQTHDSSQ